jgi:hypothetical protein
MNSQITLQISSPSHEKEYRAVGIVRGQYYPSLEDFSKGVLVTSDGMIPALIGSKGKHFITPDIINSELLFCVYPRTKKELGNALTLELVRYRQQPLDADNYFSVRGNLVAVLEESILVRIHRNNNKNYFFYLGVKGTLPHDGVEKFWDLECVRSGNILKLINARVIVSPEIASTRVAEQPIVSKPKPTVVKSTKKTQEKGIKVRSEITLKFNEIPSAEPTPDKKVKMVVSDENSNKFIILLNAKSYRKACEAAATYPKHAGKISGKLGKLTEEGFEVNEAGIQIFEVQPKEKEETA